MEAARQSAAAVGVDFLGRITRGRDDLAFEDAVETRCAPPRAVDRARPLA